MTIVSSSRKFGAVKSTVDLSLLQFTLLRLSILWAHHSYSGGVQIQDDEICHVTCVTVVQGKRKSVAL
jgi:hypothetical protein